LRAVEVESSDHIFHYELRNLEYFIRKFNAREGIVAYSGPSRSYNKVKLISFVELFELRV
jgi:hypothetical protein